MSIDAYDGARFEKNLQLLIHQATFESATVTIARNIDVYQCGDRDDLLYIIVDGNVKLLTPSSENKDCLLAIHTSGDLFGETCLSGLGARVETATAMEDTVLRQITRRHFLARLQMEPMFVTQFISYLTNRISDQKRLIANLATVDCEQRLGRTLLRLGETLGRKVANSICIDLRITHEELSEMVGTTRPRISVFLQRFRRLGLIETNPEHLMLIKQSKLTRYLAQIA